MPFVSKSTPIVRLLADDLTGALDTAAEFVPLCGAFKVSWPPGEHPSVGKSFGIDSGTRELDDETSTAIISPFIRNMTGCDIAFKKVDSLLRGPWAAELAACLRHGPWKSCIFAPAFPFQRRRTRNGNQLLETDDGEVFVSNDIVMQLAKKNIPTRLHQYADIDLAEGVTVFDAESDKDLVHVVEIGRRHSNTVLWCGSGGLAGALAAGAPHLATPTLRTPILGLFGSDHISTRAQLMHSKNFTITVIAGEKNNAARVEATSRSRDVLFVKVAFGSPVSRAEAAARIADEIATITRHLSPKPATLVVSGGETLKALALALGAQALRVTGRLLPGVPVSRLCGGAWDGIDVISKSGAFGPPDLWQSVLPNHQREPQ